MTADARSKPEKTWTAAARRGTWQDSWTDQPPLTTPLAERHSVSAELSARAQLERIRRMRPQERMALALALGRTCREAETAARQQG